MHRILMLGMLVGTLGGCASYSLTPITPTDAEDLHENGTYQEGYVFYSPQPYLFGTLNEVPPKAAKASAKAGNPAKSAGKESGKPDGQELPTYTFKLIYLPDYSRPYRFTRTNFLAKADLKIVFKDGWLFTGAESKTDTTTVVTSLVDLVGDMIKPLESGKDEPPAKFALFKIIPGNPTSLQEVKVEWATER